MNRASPADLRKAIEAANACIKAGILFVPVPVLNDFDYAVLAKQANDRLDALLKESQP